MKFQLSALIIAASFVFLGFAAMNIADKVVKKGDSVAVTGTAERVVVSDSASWSIRIESKQHDDTKLAKEDLIEIKKEVLAFLKGNKSPEPKESMITVTKICKKDKDDYGSENCSLGILGYTASQYISMETPDVYLVNNLSIKVAENFSDIDLSNNTNYYYNNLKNIRADMLSEATRNAKERAEGVASAGGAIIGSITSLSSGVFQVTAVNSVDFSDYGSYNTNAIEKKITATVKANFSVR